MDLILIISYLLILALLILKKRKIELCYLAIATLLSLVWSFFSKDQYLYNQNFLSIFGYSLFPFFSWAIGLFAIYIFYLRFENRIKSNFGKFIFFTCFYWLMLILAETIFYHYFDVRNIATQIYAGLPFCDCLHAPPWMKLVYFAFGPVYYSIIFLFKKQRWLKNS